jgi:HEAT repeat protein
MLNFIGSFVARVFYSLGFRQASPNSKSIFELIAAQVARDPNWQMDESLFPKVLVSGDSKLSFAAGALDAVIRSSSDPDKDREAVKLIISNVRDGKITNWKQIEARLHGIRAIGCVDPVLEDIKRSGITFKAVRLFWTTAKRSSNYEAIKWGLVIGSLSDDDAEKLHDLLIFARHPEFTLYCGHAVCRLAAARPELKRYLVELLPLSKQWGVIKLIEQIVCESDLIQDAEVQRKVLIFGMENNDGIPMEIAFTIAENIELPRFIHLAETDTRVYVAIFQLMETLITEPNPLGGIDELPDGEMLVAEYVQMLTKRSSDVRMLLVLRELEQYLAAREPGKQRPTELLLQVRQLWKNNFDDNVLRVGLKNSDTRWRTLNLIERLRAVSLLPEVREAFQQDPDYASISVLVEIGSVEDLRLLFAAIPRLVNMKDRAGRKISPINIPVTESKGAFEYSRIVEGLGRLATPEAIAHLKLAASDYDPTVRRSACKALARLPLDKADGEIARLIHERLNDPLAYVREAAKEARAKLVL